MLNLFWSCGALSLTGGYNHPTPYNQSVFHASADDAYYTNYRQHTTGEKEMTNQQLDQAIEAVAKSTNSTKQEVADRLYAGDFWTSFLIGQAQK